AGSQGRRPVPPTEETRPRRATDEPQEEKPIKLKADLVTVITSVTDSAGNQINDLTQKDFEIYEDNQLQDIAGVYREGQVPLRMIFLFDTSSSIRHRFDFEQRAAAQFFRNVMHRGDQVALLSVSTDPRIQFQFTSAAGSVNVQDLAGEFVLKAMCEDTGGRAFFPPIYDDQKKETRDLDEIYKRLAAEVRAQYVLTYYSKGELVSDANPRGRVGTFRAI